MSQAADGMEPLRTPRLVCSAVSVAGGGRGECLAWGTGALSPTGAVLVSVACGKEETYPSWARQWECTWICGGDSVGFWSGRLALVAGGGQDGAHGVGRECGGAAGFGC